MTYDDNVAHLARHRATEHIAWFWGDWDRFAWVRAL